MVSEKKSFFFFFFYDGDGLTELCYISRINHGVSSLSGCAVNNHIDPRPSFSPFYAGRDLTVLLATQFVRYIVCLNLTTYYTAVPHEGPDWTQTAAIYLYETADILQKWTLFPNRNNAKTLCFVRCWETTVSWKTLILIFFICSFLRYLKFCRPMCLSA